MRPLLVDETQRYHPVHDVAPVAESGQSTRESVANQGQHSLRFLFLTKQVKNLC